VIEGLSPGGRPKRSTLWAKVSTVKSLSIDLDLSRMEKQQQNNNIIMGLG